MKMVTVETKTVGQAHGTHAEIRDAKTGRKLATTMVRPYGFDAAALADADAIVSGYGWTIADAE